MEGKVYSADPRERVAAVEREGMSRNRAAVRFGVVVSTAINWMPRHRETGRVAPGRIGGHKRRIMSGANRNWLLERTAADDFTLRDLVSELAERGVMMDHHSVWDFARAEDLSFKKRAAGQAAL